MIDFRDEPKAKIPQQIEPSSYHYDELAVQNKRLLQLISMTDAELLAEMRAKNRKDRKYHKDAITSSVSLKEKYEAMLAQVKKFRPPSKEHHELKKFMIEQIESSIEFDCDSEYHKKKLEEIKEISAAVYRQRELKEVNWKIKHHQKELQKEIARAGKRTR